MIDGIRHNIPFLAALMQHERWRQGKLSTGFIAEEFPKGFHPVAPAGEAGQTLAAVAAAIDHVLGERKRRISGQRPDAAVTRERRRVVRLGDAEFVLDINREDDGLAVRFDGGAKRHVVVVGLEAGRGALDRHGRQRSGRRCRCGRCRTAST